MNEWTIQMHIKLQTKCPYEEQEKVKKVNAKVQEAEWNIIDASHPFDGNVENRANSWTTTTTTIIKWN